MITSDALRATFVFADLTDDQMCHLSFNCGGRLAVNVQIPVSEIDILISNLSRVLQEERKRLESENYEQREQLDEFLEP